MNDKIQKSNEEWKQVLTPEQYHVTREKGTESAFTGKYTDTEDPGMYHCSNCGAQLFSSQNKFHSGSGWPSFDAPASSDTIEQRPDIDHGMQRIEVVCRRCGAHLGHVFEDGPPTTGQRFCINSCALDLEKKDDGN